MYLEGGYQPRRPERRAISPTVTHGAGARAPTPVTREQSNNWRRVVLVVVRVPFLLPGSAVPGVCVCRRGFQHRTTPHTVTASHSSVAGRRTARRAAGGGPRASGLGRRAVRLRRSQLVVAVLGDVAHPRQRLVARLLNDLQVPDLDARHGEIRDLELDADRGPALGLLTGDAR